MVILTNTKVYRGGITASNLTCETKECLLDVNTKDKALDFKFNLASKGGGITSVCLQVGIDDFSTILTELARRMPEQAGVLSECATIANRKNLELLIEARRVQDDDTALAQSLVEQLETVEQFVSEKYDQAPAGQDEKEATAKEQLEVVMSTLRAIR